MNKSIKNISVLHILWMYFMNLFNRFNTRYLIMPIIYIFIVLLIVPEIKMTNNTITREKFDSYVTIVSREDKTINILEKYGLTREQFNILSAIVLTEAETNSYEDAYAVINTIYNRTKSKNWVKIVDNLYGENKGNNLYYQAITPRQFVVYEHGSYKKNLNNTNSVGYDAIIDFLYTEEVMHNYLSFRANNVKIKNSEKFSKNGNNYFNLLSENNRI